MCPKGNKLLGMLKESTSKVTRSPFFLQLVRSNFTFASQVSCSQSVALIDDIEKIQSIRVTKFILNFGFVTVVPHTYLDLNISTCFTYNLLAPVFRLGVAPLNYKHARPSIVPHGNTIEARLMIIQFNLQYSLLKL